MTSDTQTGAADMPPSWLDDLADTLLPGGGGWPSATAAGIGAMLAHRIRESAGSDGLVRIEAALRGSGGHWPADEPARIAAVAAFEASDPALFGQVLEAAYYAYYESPLVVAAIHAKGRPYQLTPHRSGFELRPFDPARDIPSHGRGHYVATGDVRFVDAGPLDLASNTTQSWGVRR